VKGTWREGSCTGNSESYIRHVKEGYGKGAALFIEDPSGEPGVRTSIVRTPRDT